MAVAPSRGQSSVQHDALHSFTLLSPPPPNDHPHRLSLPFCMLSTALPSYTQCQAFLRVEEGMGNSSSRGG